MKLVIAEKPEVARAIVSAILKDVKKYQGYAEGSKDGERFAVTNAFGHLFDLAEPETIDKKYGAWREEDLPIAVTDWPLAPGREEYKRARLSVIQALLKEADTVINAGDPDDEGQLLIDEILDYCHFQGEELRVYINDNLPQNIIKEFGRLKKNEDCRANGRAAAARRQADMCFGVNESRLASLRLKRKGLSVGRVQTPTLGLVVARDEQIEGHVKEVYYSFTAKVGKKGMPFLMKPDPAYLKDNGLERLSDLAYLQELAKKMQGAKIDITTTEKEKVSQPPLPYNLTVLQAEMNAAYGYSMEKTLDLTQSLREKKAITYNRTDSRYLSEEHFKEAPQVLATILGGSLVQKYPLDFTRHSAAFNDKLVTAHHGIIPQKTNISLESLTKDEANVYLAICNRYAGLFMPPKRAMESLSTFTFTDGPYTHTFQYKAVKVTDPGWSAYLKGEEADNKEEKPDGKVYVAAGSYPGATVTGTEITEKETAPPPRYTEGSLAKDMASVAKYVKDPEIRAILKKKDEGKKGENGSIGTVATRGEIVAALIKKGFLERKGKALISTPLGRQFYHMLPPEISAADTTAKWWLIQEQIREGTEKDVNAIQKAVVAEFLRHRDTAYQGQDLRHATDSLGACPNCGRPVASGKYGPYCTGRCGISLGRAFGKQLTDLQLSKLLEGKTVLMKGFKSKKGTSYSAKLTLEGVEDYEYKKEDGTVKKGKRLRYKMELPELPAGKPAAKKAAESGTAKKTASKKKKAGAAEAGQKA